MKNKFKNNRLKLVSQSLINMLLGLMMLVVVASFFNVGAANLTTVEAQSTETVSLAQFEIEHDFSMAQQDSLDSIDNELLTLESSETLVTHEEWGYNRCQKTKKRYKTQCLHWLIKYSRSWS